jgi:hypothetical protein
VRDVGAVEALALHDQSLRPDHLLGWNEAHRHPDHFRRHGVIEPDVVDLRDAVAGAEDQIDEVVAVKCLAEPMRKRQLRLVSRPMQDIDGALVVLAASLVCRSMPVYRPNAYAPPTR